MWRARATTKRRGSTRACNSIAFCEVTPFRLLVLLSFFSPDPAKASYEATGTTCLCTHDYSSLLRVVQPLGGAVVGSVILATLVVNSSRFLQHARLSQGLKIVWKL